MPFSALYGDYAARCATVGVTAKSKRAVAMALEKGGFAKSKADGGKIHYAARVRPRLAVVAA